MKSFAGWLVVLVVRSRLPEVFLPFGQVGVGISGGLEAAIYSVCLFWPTMHCDDPDLALQKVNMKNAFSQCNRASFLAEVPGCFPGISAWTHWCYAQPAKLRFGDQRILASAIVQQEDPLDLLLFSLVLLGFICSAGLHSNICLPLWYLDDGTFIGPQSSLTALLTLFSQDGPVFGVHLNLAKYEIFWPSGDSKVSCGYLYRVGIISGGVELLGCPLWEV